MPLTIQKGVRNGGCAAPEPPCPWGRQEGIMAEIEGIRRRGLPGRWTVSEAPSKIFFIFPVTKSLQPHANTMLGEFP